MELNHPEDRLIDHFEDVTPLEPSNMDSGFPPVTKSAGTIPNALPSESSSLMSNTESLSPYSSTPATIPESNHISGTLSCSSKSSEPTITVVPESPLSPFSGHAVKTSESITSTVTPASRHESGTLVVLIITT